MQDFFREVLLPYEAVAILLMGFVAELTKEPLPLALDRTNWKTRGNDVNLLVLSVCLGDAGLPMLWIDLRMAGNSDSSCRLGLIRQFVELCGTEKIHVLVGDREFIGQEWFAESVSGSPYEVTITIRLKDPDIVNSLLSGY